MEHRIGSTGVRVLATTCAAIAAFGLVVVWNGIAGGPGTVATLGFVVIGLAIAGLTTLAWSVTMPGRAKAPGAAPTPESPHAEFEYESVDAPADMAMVDVVGRAEMQPIEVEATSTPPPARPVVSPPLTSKDPRQWPDRRGQTNGPKVRKDLAAKYTQQTPVMRDILTNGETSTVVEHIPEVTAKVPSPTQVASGTLPDGYTKGKCGKCATHLFAPTARPIRLRCPSCSKTTLLR